MNYLQNQILEGINKEFLKENLSHDESIDFSIKTSKTYTISAIDENFQQLLDYASKATLMIIESLENDYNFFEPSLSIRLDGEIKIKICIKKKDSKK